MEIGKKAVRKINNVFLRATFKKWAESSRVKKGIEKELLPAFSLKILFSKTFLESGEKYNLC